MPIAFHRWCSLPKLYRHGAIQCGGNKKRRRRKKNNSKNRIFSRVLSFRFFSAWFSASVQCVCVSFVKNAWPTYADSEQFSAVGNATSARNRIFYYGFQHLTYFIIKIIIGYPRFCMSAFRLRCRQLVCSTQSGCSIYGSN